MKALSFIWRLSNEYKKHVVTPGAFHTGMIYIGMVTGHKCRASGYSEIEAGLVTSGYLGSVLKAKAYAKALFCLNKVSKAMERLLFERFVDEENIQVTKLHALLSLVQTVIGGTWTLRYKTPPLSQSLRNMWRVNNRYAPDAFWLIVINHTSLILMLLYYYVKN